MLRLAYQHNVAKEYGLTITLEDLKFVYQVKLAKKGMYTFKANSAAQALIHIVPKDGGYWKSKFFFIQNTGWDTGMDFAKFDLNTSSIFLQNPNFPLLCMVLGLICICI